MHWGMWWKICPWSFLLNGNATWSCCKYAPPRYQKGKVCHRTSSLLSEKDAKTRHDTKSGVGSSAGDATLLLRGILNIALREGQFPRRWKKIKF